MRGKCVRPNLFLRETSLWALVSRQPRRLCEVISWAEAFLAQCLAKSLGMSRASRNLLNM